MIPKAALDDLRKAIEHGEIIHPLFYGLIIEVLDERNALLDRCCIEAQRHMKTAHTRDALLEENKRLKESCVTLGIEVNGLADECERVRQHLEDQQAALIRTQALLTRCQHAARRPDEEEEEG